MDCTVKENNFEGLKSLLADTSNNLNWSSVLVLPDWFKVWWQSFKDEQEPFIRTVHQGDTIIGVAPLMKKGATLSFIGSTDVCDYQDFIVEPGKESDFSNALLEYLKKTGVSDLNLAHVRPDSIVVQHLLPAALQYKFTAVSSTEDVSFEIGLPSTFEAYLESLTAKQRHEVRRKLRRLTEEGDILFRFVEKGPGLDSALQTFFHMFVTSRQDKADFLTDAMQRYFRLLTDVMSERGLLKLGVLELDSKPVAEIMCFDYNDCIYLYNSGYDPQYISLSVGLLSKVFAIRNSIENGKKRFDFLKGAEPYKAHLGGREVPLSRCLITL